jgi:hypothetical protein
MVSLSTIVTLTIVKMTVTMVDGDTSNLKPF